LDAELKDVIAATASGLVVTPADFEKDQDLNFHIDFITSASNLRATNYSIKQATRHSCKMIAGKIIPAIATTTSAICGLVCLEVYKLVQKRPMASFRDCNINLGVNSFQFFEPTPAKVYKGEFSQIMQCDIAPYKPSGFTKWDKFVVREGDLTIRQVVEHIKARHGVTVTGIESVKANLLPEESRVGQFVYDGSATQLDTKVTDRLERYWPGLIVTPQVSSTIFTVTAENEEGEEVATPLLVYFWK